MTVNRDNLDQMFTSAAFAMKFAAENWREFGDFTERITGHAVPIGQADMLAFGLRIAGMVDLDAMQR